VALPLTIRGRLVRSGSLDGSRLGKTVHRSRHVVEELTQISRIMQARYCRRQAAFRGVYSDIKACYDLFAPILHLLPPTPYLAFAAQFFFLILPHPSSAIFAHGIVNISGRWEMIHDLVRVPTWITPKDLKILRFRASSFPNSGNY
jgi:hypothetical protein